MANNKSARQAAAVLRQITRRGHWIPEELFKPLHSVVSWWATELVILRKRGGETGVLLARYEGEAFRGQWHIPGGYNRWDETIDQTIKRVARRELPGVRVELVRQLGAIKWRAGEHPYGRPLSLFCLCSEYAIRPTETLRFFPLDRLPRPMVPLHRRFLKSLETSAR